MLDELAFPSSPSTNNFRRVLCILCSAKVLKGEDDIRDQRSAFTEVKFALFIVIILI